MKSVKLCLVLALVCGIVMAQSAPKIPLIGEPTPAFRAQSTQGILNFPEDFGTHWKLIVSFPLDFTPVCSSELLELACRQDDFKALNVAILILSADSLYNHHLWLESLEEVSYKGSDSRDIGFPVLADQDYKITRKFGMLHHPHSSKRDIRGVFLIDPENTIRYLQFYPVEIGQNIEELKRVVIALQTFDKDGVYTPVNWQPGDDVILPCVAKSGKADPAVHQLTWYMTFKKQSDPIVPDLASNENFDK